MHDVNNEHQPFALPGTRPQYGPDRLVNVEEIDLYLVPDIENESLEGVCTMTVRALDEAVPQLALDAVDLQISRVELHTADAGRKPLKFRRLEGKLEINFDPPIAAGEVAVYSIAYRVVKPRHGLFFVKPTAARPEKIAHAWTQSQDQYARYWFPCLDYPYEKQRTTTTIVVPKGTVALGNGELVERKDEGESTIFRYRQEVPHSTYLMTMVAGPFVEVEQGRAGRNGVPISYYVLPGRENDGHRSFDKTPQMVEAFEQRLGRAYPYARYSQIAVTDFIFGGMENTSATTQTDRTLHDETAQLDFSSDPLVSHELAHQWFGDLLTCRDWAHAWLNEGFATYMEAIWREADLGHDEYLYDIFVCRTQYFKEETERYRRPIVCNTFRDPIDIFDRHLYQKGGAVLHMLRGELGDARFWRSIGEYVRRNAQGSVETIDLIRAIEEATGRNMRRFFDQWVFGAGYPQLEISITWDAQRKIATLNIDQKQPIDEANPPFDFDVDVAFAPAAGDERRIRAHVERAHESVAVALDFEPAAVRFDPGSFLLADVRYRLGADLSAAVLERDPDVVARIRAARELAADGSQAARRAVAAAFERDEFWGVLAEAAAAAGATRAPWARDLLIGGLAHKHPKVVRAVADALGNFRDSETAGALIAIAQKHPSYFVRAAALTALGKTRDPRALEILRAATTLETWNSIVESGAVRGLGELGDPRAIDAILEACLPRRGEGLRRAAVAALGRIGALVESARMRAVDEIGQRFDDEEFMVSLEAVSAAESLGDENFLPALDRLAGEAFDGRLRRHAAEAAAHIRKGGKVPAQVRSLRNDIDELREEQRRLQDKIEAALAHP